MKARITKVDSHKSRKTDGVAYLVCLKGEDGKSYNSWVDSGYRNYQGWKDLMVVDNLLDNLRVAKGNLIDADSRPILIEEDNEQTRN